MKVLVCGGAGYIGSHTVKSLIQEGYEVVVLDNLSSGRRELLGGGEFIPADLNDKEAVKKAFRAHRVRRGAPFRFPHPGRRILPRPRRNTIPRTSLTSLNLLDAMLEARV